MEPKWSQEKIPLKLPIEEKVKKSAPKKPVDPEKVQTPRPLKSEHMLAPSVTEATNLNE